MSNTSMMDKTVCKQLSREFAKLWPEAGQDDISSVVGILTGERIHAPTELLAESLLASHPCAGELLIGLLQAATLSIRHCMQTDTDQEPLSVYSKCMARFSILQTAIMHVATQAADKPIHAARPTFKEYEHLWVASRCVHLHNYFHEIPIHASARFIRLDGQHLHISLCPELTAVFSASDDLRSALIASPDQRHNLRVKVEKRVESEVILFIDGIEAAGREKREHIRVKVEERLAITGESNGRLLHGSIADMSSAGLCVEFPAGSPIRDGDQLKCAWKIAQKPVLALGVVRWTVGQGEILRTGIRFQTEKTYRERIYKFLFSKQQNIIARLRRLDTPDWMRLSQR
ncbi:MAG: PilZ domain-containing protein [Mariprofundaceae bacterium]|nr:PilZ domain-containing protein [Mariprofundaceae bacterium]